MSRFVLVSFAFLGWGFFELSGGASFTPPVRPATVETPLAQPANTSPTGRDISVSATSLVTRTGIEQRQRDLVRSRFLETQVSARAEPQAALRTADAGLALDPAGGDSADSSQPAQNPAPRIPANLITAGLGSGGLQLASLEAGIGGGLEEDAQEQRTPPVPATGITEPEPDLRSIRAARVNMRQGPGTAYPIVTRLLAGDEVVVIADSGTGWLHLRTPDNQHFGWIAASLVSKKTP